MDENILKKIPRGFDQLDKFELAVDKEAFATNPVIAQIAIIEKPPLIDQHY
jgi:hypothetical protein